ncbi:DUF1918 domain-containing protein, partial [Allokutzneria albata]|uniref:DUF1918 domain-containing protein n=1 Tax=Allokutzneria albata TaxID=211114 RepID=A0A1G9SJG8_ALLAB
MKAKVGDWIVVEGTRVGEPRREGVVVEVPHADGSPPYRVRWVDTDRATLLFPGPDARVQYAGAYTASGDR